MIKALVSKMKKVHHWSILKQQMFIYIIAGMLPLFLVTSVIIYSLSTVILNTTYKEFYKEAETANSNLQQNLYNVEAVMNWIAFDNALHRLLIDEYTSPIDYYEQFQTVHNSVMQLRSLYVEIEKIEFLHNNPTTTSGSEFLYIGDGLEEEYNQFIHMENIEKGVIIYDDSVENYIIYQLLSLYKGNPKYKVLAKVQLNDDAFLKQFENTRNIEYYFLNSNKEIMYANSHDALAIEEDNHKYLIYETYYRTANRFGGYKLYSRIAKYALIEDFINVYIILFFAMMISFLLSYFLLRKLINFSSKRLVDFSDHMDSMTEELTTFSCEDYSDEVGNAIDNYNKMVGMIHKMIIEKNQNELREKNLELENTRARLYVLYSQINPHFLSNTLNGIKMNCVIKGEKETANILGELSKMFRSLMLYSEPMAALWQEVDFIETYLKIQKFRFKEKLEYSIIIDDQARLQPIPRMTLQPLVENSCIHGIQKNAEGGMIQIHAFVKDQHFRIVTTDNGVGIGDKQLNIIRERMITEDIQESSIGIINVYKRLKFYYGDNLTFEVEKATPRGTKIHIDIDLQGFRDRSIEINELEKEERHV